MRKYNKVKSKGQWFDFPQDTELKLFIKPFSLFTMSKLPSEQENNNMNMGDLFPSFNYCVTDWKGFVDEDGKELKCNEENKKLIFDFDQEIVNFVIDKAMATRSQVYEAQEVKNLPKSHDGEAPKKEKSAAMTV
jgi:hypothetical protein